MTAPDVKCSRPDGGLHDEGSGGIDVDGVAGAVRFPGDVTPDRCAQPPVGVDRPPFGSRLDEPQHRLGPSLGESGPLLGARVVTVHGSDPFRRVRPPEVEPESDHDEAVRQLGEDPSHFGVSDQHIVRPLQRGAVDHLCGGDPGDKRDRRQGLGSPTGPERQRGGECPRCVLPHRPRATTAGRLPGRGHEEWRGVETAPRQVLCGWDVAQMSH